MIGIGELADRTLDEEVIAMEALKSLSESQRANQSLTEPTPVTAQRQLELQGRFRRKHPELPQQAGLTQQPVLRGVWFNRNLGKWHANIGAVGRIISLGTFDSEDEAARLHDKAALRIRGQKASLNFPLSDYLLPDGTLALDLQVEAFLLEAFLGRDAGDEPGGPSQQQSASGTADETPASSSSVGDLVRLCLGRINRADRTELQEAAEALGPGYMHLMNLIKDAGQVLAASSTGGGSGAIQARLKHDGDGGGGESGGGEGEWVSERRDTRRSPSSHHVQLQQQQGGGWQGQTRTGAPSVASEHVRVNQTRQQQLHLPQEGHLTQPQQHGYQQQHQSPQVQSDIQDRQRPLQAQPHGKDIQHQQQRRDVTMDDSPPPRDLPERTRAPRNHVEMGPNVGAAVAVVAAHDAADTTATRGPGFGGSAATTVTVTQGASEKKTSQALPTPAAAPHYQPEVLQTVCSLLTSSIHQVQQVQARQPQADGARQPPPVVKAVGHLISTGIPTGLLLQAAEVLARSRLLSYKDYEALAAWVSERGCSVSAGQRAALDVADAAPSALQQHHRSQHTHQKQQQQQPPLDATMDAGVVGASPAGGAAAPQGLARGGSIGALKRKSADTTTGVAATAAATGGSGGNRGEQPSSAVIPTAGAAASYGNEDVPPTAKRQHRHRMTDPSSGPAQLVLVPATTMAGAAGRSMGVDVGGTTDMTTSMAMAAAVAAASTAGGVPIGIPTAPHEQARAVAAVAAATAALPAPAAPPQPARTQVPLAAPAKSADGLTVPLMHSAVSDCRTAGAVSGGAGSGTLRQPIGLGRRLFNAISGQLPPGAELDCLLPPRYGYVGVMYSFPGSTRVGAALWDGSEVVNLGVYTSDRDARQAVASSSSIANRVAAPPVAAQPSSAVVVARRVPSVSPGPASGVPLGKPSVITTGTTSVPPAPAPLPTVGSMPEVGSMAATAAAAAARSTLLTYQGGNIHKAAGSGGGGGCSSGSGPLTGTMTSGPAVAPMPRSAGGRQIAFTLGRDGASGSAGSPPGGVSGPHGHSNGGGGGGCPAVLIRPLPTAVSSKSVLSGDRSSLAPSQQEGVATAAAVLQSGGGGAAGCGRPEQACVAPARGAQGAAAAATAPGPSELDTVGSSLPKGPVIGPFLVGPPEVAADGSLQLVCQLFVQQDEPLSSDDLNNVIAQRITAANLQSLLDMAGNDPMLAAAAVAAANVAAANMEQQAQRPAGTGIGPQTGPTITTTLTGPTQGLPRELPPADVYRLQHPNHHHPSGPSKKDIGLYSQQHPQRALYPSTAAGTVPQGSPPMPFAIRDAVLHDRDRELDRDRERDRETDSPQDGLVDAASVRGPLQLLPPTASQQPPSSHLLAQQQSLSHSSQQAHPHPHHVLPQQQQQPQQQHYMRSNAILAAGGSRSLPPSNLGGSGGGGGSSRGISPQRGPRVQTTSAEAAGTIADYERDNYRESVGREEGWPSQQDPAPSRPASMAAAAVAPPQRTTSRLARRGSGGNGEILPIGTSGCDGSDGGQAGPHVLTIPQRPYSSTPSPVRIYERTNAGAASPQIVGRLPTSAAAAAAAAAAVVTAGTPEPKSLGAISAVGQLQARREASAAAATTAAIAGASHPPRQSQDSRDGQLVSRGGGAAGGVGDTDEAELAYDESGEGDEPAAARQDTPVLEEADPAMLKSRPQPVPKGLFSRAAGDCNVKGEPNTGGSGETATVGVVAVAAAPQPPPPPPLQLNVGPSASSLQRLSKVTDTRYQVAEEVPAPRGHDEQHVEESFSVFAGRPRGLVLAGPDGGSSGGSSGGVGVGAAVVVDDPLENKAMAHGTSIDERSRDAPRSSETVTAGDPTRAPGGCER
ncbi:hypothetical protein Vretimale_10989 [Volvox reticuliferus]|uniref:AP2/ERF domain-containing protein n=1 Tax=Volvox reticuliferus TaxID=1737510 RepID=A0A8J4FTT5_9CHLO|nr:hypothetical protein Vretifemale_12718 [Volvox reticuliferus]GIM06728.1 hypothetical protein Vretimale_10989 [Volvox reticuliferus]